MKTYCKGLEFTRKSVVEALHRWKKSDSGKENGWRVADEYGTETAFVDRIWLELSTETLTFEPIRTYLKHDPNNGKLREISVESIKRQVCNYLCVGALEPLLAAKVGFWQVSSGVKGKGAALGMRKLRREARGMSGVVRRRRLFSRQLKALAQEGRGHRRTRFGAARIVAEAVEGEAQRRRAHRLRGLSHLVRPRAPGRLAKEALETTATRVRALHAQAHRALGEARVLLLGLAENGCHGAPDERQAVHIQRGEGRGLGGKIWL